MKSSVSNQHIHSESITYQLRVATVETDMGETRNTHRAFVGSQKARGLGVDASIILKWIHNT